MARAGFRYITVQVRDVEAAHRHLCSVGFTEGRPPMRLGDTAYISFITDLGGNWIELSQRASLTGPLPDVFMTLATIAPLIITGAIGAALVGAISVESMMNLALAAGENPGMITFGTMFLASPVQWLTGRSQVRVRKYLGIVFFLLALSNAAMFVLEAGLLTSLGAPFLIAGTIAVALATPLFLTSSRRAQRFMGMKHWRLLHKLTYPLAVALLAHVVFMGEIGPGAIMIALGLIARLPAVRRRLGSMAKRGR